MAGHPHCRPPKPTTTIRRRVECGKSRVELTRRLLRSSPRRNGDGRSCGESHGRWPRLHSSCARSERRLLLQGRRLCPVYATATSQLEMRAVRRMPPATGGRLPAPGVPAGRQTSPVRTPRASTCSHLRVCRLCRWSGPPPSEQASAGWTVTGGLVLLQGARNHPGTDEAFHHSIIALRAADSVTRSSARSCKSNPSTSTRYWTIICHSSSVRT